MDGSHKKYCVKVVTCLIELDWDDDNILKIYSVIISLDQDWFIGRS